MNLEQLSKEVSYALRHAPEEYELELDDEGFVPVAQLLLALNESAERDKPIRQSDLEAMIRCAEKKRHEIVGEKIRALYGHSLPKKIRKIQGVPPNVLFHGTTQKAASTILSEGLRPMGRQYVHLSVDEETAQKVGLRRAAEPAILRISAQAANNSGVRFFIGNDKVWLSDEAPTEFIARLEN